MVVRHISGDAETAGGATTGDAKVTHRFTTLRRT
jgi:hypothetical protein